MMDLVLSFHGRATHWTSSSAPRKPWSMTLTSLARRPLTGEGNGREKGGGREKGRGEREREGGVQAPSLELQLQIVSHINLNI